jgi:hypothetical protein
VQVALYARGSTPNKLTVPLERRYEKLGLFPNGALIRIELVKKRRMVCVGEF